MGVRQHPAMSIDGQATADVCMAACEESAPLARFAEAKFFKLDDGHDREAVVKFRDVDVTRTKPGHFVGHARRLSCAELGKARCAHQVLVGVIFADTLEVNRL